MSNSTVNSVAQKAISNSSSSNIINPGGSGGSSNTFISPSATSSYTAAATNINDFNAARSQKMIPYEKPHGKAYEKPYEHTSWQSTSWPKKYNEEEFHYNEDGYYAKKDPDNKEHTKDQTHFYF
jgi:hypothetical protein